MLESMTGTARVSRTVAGLRLTVFLKSVNHKFADFHLRYPPTLNALHKDFNDRISRRIARGRVEADISLASPGRRPVIQKKVLNSYLKMTAELSGRKGKPDEQLLTRALQLPGVLELEDDWPRDFKPALVLKVYEEAVAKLQESRRKEGRKIGVLLTGYLKKIARNSKRIEKRLNSHEARQIAHFKSKVQPRLKAETRDMEALRGAVVEWYGRFNVKEELERLKLHNQALLDLLKEGGLVGKKTDFFSQELLREVNTIASKCGDFEIRELVVDMKNEIENIKEQARNLC